MMMQYIIRTHHIIWKPVDDVDTSESQSTKIQQSIHNQMAVQNSFPKL